MKKREIGTKKETLARKLLLLHGYEILEMNYRSKSGEVDVVAREGDYLVFIEVKYRSTTEFGEPQQAVDVRKQQKIRKVARDYCYLKRLPAETPIRFDVVAILGEKYKIIQDAFY